MKMGAARTEKRKHCPFCGTKEAALHKIKLEVQLPYRIVCQGCGAAGPWKMSAEEAREGWEKRHALRNPRKWRCVENGRYTYEGD